MVTLSIPELRHAAYLGIDRYIRAIANDRSPLWGQGHNDPAAHILGAWGECVVARAIDCYWSETLGHPDGGDADVGAFHVRTAPDPKYRLILHPEDHDSAPYVLVVIERLPSFRVAGWCYGSDGKQEKFWGDPAGTGRHAFFVPQSALRPLVELPS